MTSKLATAYADFEQQQEAAHSKLVEAVEVEEALCQQAQKAIHSASPLVSSDVEVCQSTSYTFPVQADHTYNEVCCNLGLKRVAAPESIVGPKQRH